ncbi:MAG: hypothetical protein DMG36_24015 [Acidobacteria bacterium]|nr:MAG: hypothetical protein DMG36_24015 [Acidobacteriota bacterium]
MSLKPTSTFHYHACAHAFSGRFTRPFDHLIEVQAATALPIIGGHGNSRVENFQFREFVSFKKGYTHVSGGHQADDGSHNTLVTSVIERLNLLDIVTADRLVARLYSKHKPGDVEGTFSLVGSKFENLQIAGCPVQIELNLDLMEKIGTFELAQKEFAKKDDFRKIAEDPFQTGKPMQAPGLNGVFLCSWGSCDQIRRADPNNAAPGNRLCRQRRWIRGTGLQQRAWLSINFFCYQVWYS